MLVPGFLGLNGVVLVSLLVVFLVIRHMLRNAAARKEEVTRLIEMVSHETAVVEAQSTAEYCYYPKYQCAVCFAPTTTRCSKCKSVRYCSGKCQIMHWRQGHKDECRPPADFAVMKESGMHSNDSEVESVFKTSSDTSSVVEEEDDDGNLKPHADTKRTRNGFVLSSSSSLAGVSPSTASHESFVDVSSSRTLLSGPNDKPGRELPNNLATAIPRSKTATKKMEEAISPSSESSLTYSVNNPSKLNKKKSPHNDEEVELRMQFAKDNNLMSDDVHPAKVVCKKSTGVVSSEMLVTDASKKINLTPQGSSRPKTVTKDREADLQHYESKQVRTSSCSASVDHSSSAAGGHSLPSSNLGLPAKCNDSPTLPQTTSNGLKTSMRKVVQQLKASKQSKSSLFGFGNEVNGKHNYKIIFPYELFMELYSYDALELCPFGLNNCGNSCYANAVLQCLAFTRPLTSYLVRGLHSRACRKKEWCFICEFECLILKAKEGESPLSPIRILSKIQKIGSHLGPGKEEDAHEFLRYAVDAMQSVCLKEAKAAGPLAEETTLVGLTFGGYLHSKIKCLKCLVKSERYERMMDLTVEIDGDIGSLEEALAQFTATEILDGENKYHCSRCKSYVKARKKLTVLEAPNILTIVLKRFQSGNFGKLNKSVQFPEVLDLAPYMSGTSDKAAVYNLYAVVVHLDVMNAAFSGHYVCYVKSSRGEWFRIDDSTVIPVELERVLREGAYMLLYARHTPKAPTLVRSNLESHGTRVKKRNLEAVPSSHNTSKTRSDSNFSRLDSSISQRKHKYPSDVSNRKHLFDSEDWRFPSVQRIPPADSSSESSSIFSGSDASSCSTTSTKDSSRSEDFSDYLFGEMGPEWYSRYGISSDSGAEINGHARSMNRDGNSTILYTDSSRHRRSSSSRASDFEQGGWSNLFDVRSSSISFGLMGKKAPELTPNRQISP
ncbi:Peptidase C19, ubiquitin carboxyl-terminal hydrolase 2 [Corchorus capsularis]|uniref:ubiquitinyl hydrolase 1 n=1 Tax=Corchorus capsularis TaxID=210143 RepID=A0A1R3GDY2_COCAP|nr:Peptidase C19, ubiquitin carboxyl-terminal hydrolase 2 [Corchorus capsularis]